MRAPAGPDPVPTDFVPALVPAPVPDPNPAVPAGAAMAGDLNAACAAEELRKRAGVVKAGVLGGDAMEGSSEAAALGGDAGARA